MDKVVDGAAAAKAGIRDGSTRATLQGRVFAVGGDAIVQIGAERVASASDVVRIVTNELAPGDVVNFTVLRDGKRVVIPVRLEKRPR